jgi:Mor family transcriptional regulator
MSKKTKQQLEQETKELLTLNNTLTDKYNKVEAENNVFKQQIKDGQLVYKVKNERGAGRKKIATDEIKNQIYELFGFGWTMDQLAKKFKLSKGTIFNTINEPE